MNDGMTIMEACRFLEAQAAAGAITGFGGAIDCGLYGKEAQERGDFAYDSLWFRRGDRHVNARHFGIIFAAFDVRDGHPLAAFYPEWGDRRETP